MSYFRFILLLLFLSQNMYSQNDYGVTIFGTEILSKKSVLKKYRHTLSSLKTLYESNRKKYQKERIALAKEISSEYQFSYVHIKLFRSYTGTFDFIIDVVEKKDSKRRLDFRTIIGKNIGDPDAIINKWIEYQNLSFTLYRQNEISDMSCPVIHCIWSFNHSKLTPYLAFFNKKAPIYKNMLIDILNTSNSPIYRAAASFILAHAHMDNNALLKVLLPSVRDPESTVRNNSLRVIYYIVRANPKLDFNVSEIISALDFPSFTDRNKSLVILRSLPVSRFSEKNLKRMIPILLEILEKKDAHNYRNAYIVLKNISGKNYDIKDIQRWKLWWAKYFQ